jgi:hypothetical protein
MTSFLNHHLFEAICFGRRETTHCQNPNASAATERKDA